MAASPDPSLPRLAARTAQEVCATYPVGHEVKGLLRTTQTPRQFLDALLERQEYVEAARFLAQALPGREAVRWACRAARQGYGPQPPEDEAAALAAAESWVANPAEAQARAAQTASEAARGTDTAGGCAALAAFWAGGNLAPPGKPTVAPAPHLAASGVAGALIRAAVLHQDVPFEAALQQLLQLGIALLALSLPGGGHEPAPGSVRSGGDPWLS